MSWEQRAICRDEDPELFFPLSTARVNQAQIAEAKAVCARCPVRVPCGIWAHANKIEFGIYAGETEQERITAIRDGSQRAREAAARAKHPSNAEVA